MVNDKFLGLLGIASGARKLCFGLERSAAAAADGQAKLIITAGDISRKSAKEAAFAADKAGIDCIGVDYTIDQLGHAVGSRAGVIAVTDDGIAQRLAALQNH
ncbi:MAG: ribosomal L7Ae/L30e/S12e/Gadd45 family protein [Firmicutes bacterium]|nr:ribosomal L7Ae/L30e/S12e/Gadd45 family protein [Bacillota bacterium]